MAYFAVLTPEMVVSRVFPGRDEDDQTGGVQDWEQHYGDFYGLQVVRTSYNTRGGIHYNLETGEPSDDQTKAFRFNYAGIGYTFDPDRGTDGAFIPPKPNYDSWVLDEDTCLWEAPVALPDDADTVAYVWDEESVSWVAQDS